MAAYLGGYLLAYPLASARLDDAPAATTVETVEGTVTAAELLATADVSVAGWQSVGWLFYNARFVSVQLPGPEVGRAVEATNLLTSTGGLLSLLLLVPALALIAAGAMATRDVAVTRNLRYDVGTGGTRYALNGGLVTMLGYMPLALLGTFVFTHGYLGADGPSTFGGWVVAGGIYPLVYGGLGGYPGRRFADVEDRSTEGRETGW
ncbi:hypothetical protein BRC81_00905 [Halobacteriales archaeon QS_1_68_20]|nr:MAG: hypothetical protein BRC81_00905 [Halobacteriales archaeon QS_1_68_20]